MLAEGVASLAIIVIGPAQSEVNIWHPTIALESVPFCICSYKTTHEHRSVCWH